MQQSGEHHAPPAGGQASWAIAPMAAFVASFVAALAALVSALAGLLGA